MKFLVFTHTEGWGGTEQHTVHLTGALSDRGHAVTLVEPGHPEYSRRRGAVDGRASVMTVDTGLPTTVSFPRWIISSPRSGVTGPAKGGFRLGSLAFDHPARLFIRTLRRHRALGS